MFAVGDCDCAWAIGRKIAETTVIASNRFQRMPANLAKFVPMTLLGETSWLIAEVEDQRASLDQLSVLDRQSSYR